MTDCDHSKKIRRHGRTVTCSDSVIVGREVRCRRCGKVLGWLGTMAEVNEINERLRKEVYDKRGMSSR